MSMDWESLDDLDLEFGREEEKRKEDKPKKCRKSKSKVRRVRNTRMLGKGT